MSGFNWLLRNMNAASIFTESQNSRDLKAPLEVIQPSRLGKQGHLEPVGQDPVQMVCYYLQGGTLHNLPGKPVPCSATLTVKKCFLVFRASCVSICAHCLRSHHWAALKRAHLHSLCTLSWVFSRDRQAPDGANSSLGYLSLSSQERYSWLSSWHFLTIFRWDGTLWSLKAVILKY